MIEITNIENTNVPKILIIGVGGGGNNAVDRMVNANQMGVSYAAINTDAQVLEACIAEHKIQIGKKITGGFGAGADPAIGESAAIESEEEIKELVKDYNMVIVTSGMGGGTGTGAAPIVAKYCRELEILTLGIVTTPFSFESNPRIIAAKSGVERMQENVDTLLVIPNDKLIGLTDKPLLLDDAFEMADTVLKYTIEGITNIIYNKGIINLDFNDLKTTLANKGKGHIGIGVISEDDSIIEAVKQAIESKLLETSISGAQNLLINTCGRKIDINGLNEAISYVREIAGEDVNIIWGTVTGKDFNEEKSIVTIIATGMPEKQNIIGSQGIPHKPNTSINTQFNSIKTMPPQLNTNAPRSIVVPEFLINARHK